MSWETKTAVCDDFLDSCKLINWFFFSRKFTKKTWHSSNLEALHFCQPDKSCYHLGYAATWLWTKRKLESRLFLINHYPLRHPNLILCWDICSYHQERIPLEWLQSFSSVKTLKIMMSYCSLKQRRYHRDPHYSPCSACEKKTLNV